MASSPAFRTFGHLPTGESVEAWTIQGSSGLLAEILTYGAIVRTLLVPGRDGRLHDVVLGFDDLDSYLADRAYFGAMVGRVAGRVTGARFSLDGRIYELPANEPPNHLHGGFQGFSKRLWTDARASAEDGSQSLCLTYVSPDGEEGYPGTVRVTVSYTVTSRNVLLIRTEACTDRATPLSLTSHCYFNLAGEHVGSVADHELQIFAERYFPAGSDMSLLGEAKPLTAANDFSGLRSLGEAIPQLYRNHGDLYSIRRPGSAGSPRVPAARLLHGPSGRMMDVSTAATHLQLYTAAGLDGTILGKSGRPYGRYAAVCLECEGYPDGANVPAMGDIILRPGHPRYEETAYAFCTF